MYWLYTIRKKKVYGQTEIDGNVFEFVWKIVIVVVDGDVSNFGSINYLERTFLFVSQKWDFKTSKLVHERLSANNYTRQNKKLQDI